MPDETSAPGSPPASTPATSPTPPPSRSAWRRLARAGAPRLTKAQLLGAALALLLGFALATQVQQTQESGLQALRQDDLVRVLDDVSQRSNRLDQQVRELQQQRDALASGAGSSQAAIQQATQQLEQLRILAGTAPAQGPGLQVTINDPDGKVTSPMLLDVLQELRDAGAEVVQFGSTRIVASSWFASSGGTVQVDGQSLARPYSILVIGDQATLAAALNIPGGIVETLRRVGATTSIQQLGTVRIDALQTPRTPRYAQPVGGDGSTPGTGTTSSSAPSSSH